MKVDLQRTIAVNRASATNQDFQLSRGEFNGVILALNSQYDVRDLLSIKLRHDGGFVTIASKVPLYVFSEISSQKFGFDYSSTWSRRRLMDAITHLSNDAAIDPATENSVDTSLDESLERSSVGFVPIAIDLGYVNLSNAELEFTLYSDTGGGTFTSMSVATYERSLEARPLIKYDMSYDFEQKHKSVLEAYNYILINAGQQTFQGKYYTLSTNSYLDLNFEVETEDDEFEVNTAVAMAGNSLFGSIESGAQQVILKIGSSTSELPEGMFVKVTGTDVSKTGMIYLKQHVIPEFLSKKTEENVVKILHKVKNIEKNDPKEAEALRHAGIITKSEALEEAKDVIEAGKDV